MKHSGGFKPFTKVTSPLGSRAFSVWVRVPSGAPRRRGLCRFAAAFLQKENHASDGSVEAMVKNRKAPCENRTKLRLTQRWHEDKVLFRKIKRRTPGFTGSSFWITAGKSIVDRMELGLHGGIGRDVADAGLLCTNLGQVEIFAEAADLVCVGA